MRKINKLTTALGLVLFSIVLFMPIGSRAIVLNDDDASSMLGGVKQLASGVTQNSLANADNGVYNFVPVENKDGSEMKPPSHLSKPEKNYREWIIWHESRGDLEAQNGTYYGLGQMPIEQYATYGGGTDTYENQLKGMDGYVYARYGSYRNAAEHWEKAGWY